MAERATAASAVSTAEIRLPRPPGVLRRALAAHPRAFDVAIVVCYLFGCALMTLIDAAGYEEAVPGPAWLSVPSYLTWPAIIWSAPRILVVSAALLFRRRYPLAGLIAVAVLQFGPHGAQALATSVALCFLLYAIPVYRSVAAGWVGYGIAMASTVLVYLVEDASAMRAQTGPAGAVMAEQPGGSIGLDIAAVVMSALWLLAILMIGINIGNRRRYLDAIIDRAHQLARERDQLAQLAVAEERSRIAREMHDIVAHSVSVMIALSEGAARAVQAAPDAAGDAMHRSAETGRSALAEMRRLLGALNEPAEGAPELVPQPGVGDLPQLIEGFREAGLRAELHVTGDAAGDRGQDLAVYRIAQEGLTNVLRYAGPRARAVVTVARFPDRTEVQVNDDGPVSPDAGPVTGVGSGRGLRGLEERVRVFGGSITAGPRPSGGWSLRAILPVDADAQDRPQMPDDRPPRPEERGPQ